VTNAAPRTESPIRIRLISPRGPLYRHRSGVWKRSLRYPPLTLTTLAALIPPELDAEVSIVDEGIEDLDPHADADIVGISAITGTAPRSYEIARQYRERGVPVVLGGVHPTLMPDEAARHADAIVVGYAEQSWPRLLRDFASGQMRERYDQGADHTLAGLPHARRDLLPGSRFALQHTIEATRGCIYKCDFCVVPSAWGRPIQRPVAEVVDELRAMRARRVIFLDLNIIADTDYAKELFTAIEPLGIRWGGLVTTTLAWDDDLLDRAARSGCRGVLIGFESLSSESLREAQKAFNNKQDYRSVVERLHERKIAVMGCFVFGFDHDSTDAFDATVQFVHETNVDLPRYAILVPFPGTPVYRRLELEGRILTRDWEYYDGQHVVFQPARMTADELLRGTERAWKATYSYRSIAKRLAGSRVQLATAISANLGYRYYAHRLNRFYTCDWMLSSS
jgi:radical SAM superfamily enzyme YgiQ (UPF0313 family)